MIPILDLTRQYKSIQSLIEPAVLSQLASGAYILGPTVEAFEQKMADYLSTGHSLGVASGTDALYLALRALDIGEGDEVITTPFSYIATSEAIARTGAKPVFCDIDETTFNLDLNQIESLITPKTKALLPVHLYGLAMDMDVLMTIAQKHHLGVVEDCAQSLGSTYKGQAAGTFGDVGCYSFFPTKNLGAAGDGGLVSVKNTELYKKIKKLRVHGAANRYYHDMEGINSRLDALQAVILSIKVDYLNQWNQQRQTIAEFYTQQFSQHPELLIPPSIPSVDQSHIYHQYTLKINPKIDRNQLQQVLLDQFQVQSMIYYPLPLHLQGMHQNLGYQKGDFPVCEKVAEQVLSLPIFPELTSEEQQTIVNSVITACKQLTQHPVTA
jgi:dTDP-4-amino-4,6-dideoxygalactose transaminase